MKLLLTITFLCTSLASLCQQDSAVVRVRVTDIRYGDPINNVSVIAEYNSDHERKSTNTRGIVHYKIPVGTGVTFKLSHNQFSSEESFRRISDRYANDTLKLDFSLEFVKQQNVDSIIVYSPGVPQIVYQSEKLHVEDFELLKNGQILLLAYQKRLKKGSELKLIEGSQTISTFQVPGEAKELVHDFRGNPHVICDNNVYGIHYNNRRVGISTLDKAYFMTYLAPILDTNDAKLYFSNFNPDYPAFEYFSFDRLDSIYRKIMKVEDELMMELYRSEYKWVDVRTKLWAKNKEIRTGIDAEIWVGANYFTQSIYYKEVYAPLFHRNDTLFVFDYYKDLLFTYDAAGDAIDSTGIYHHYNPRSTGWKKQVLQDRKTGQIYGVFERAGYTYIGKIDTKTGEIPEQVRLKHRYINKIAISGNHVYYTYRPFESIQKKYLYKERLPYNFNTSSVYSVTEN